MASNASEILRRAAALVAAGWSNGDQPTDAAGEPVPVFGGTAGDTARAGINRAIVNHTLYSAIVAANIELGGTGADLGVIWPTLNMVILNAASFRRGGTNYLHPAHQFNTRDDMTAERVQGVLHQAADRLDTSRTVSPTADKLPPVNP